jgi:mono/diheme cytochrome c family protein
MEKLLWFLSGVAACLAMIAGATILFLRTGANGFSTRAQPLALELSVARAARNLALPAGTKERKNPIRSSPEVIAEGRAHWADHCTVCHANDGSGDVEMGRRLSPPAPDMRKDPTQKMPDGELFYIIEHGIRMTGMPGWGGNGAGEEDSWKLVHFIRHLPSLTREELLEMERLNPKSREDLEEEQREEQFLKGQPVTEPATKHGHH